MVHDVYYNHNRSTIGCRQVQIVDYKVQIVDYKVQIVDYKDETGYQIVDISIM